MVMSGVDFRNVVGAMVSSGIGNFFSGMGKQGHTYTAHTHLHVHNYIYVYIYMYM
jgi:hypothetical protein